MRCKLQAQNIILPLLFRRTECQKQFWKIAFTLTISVTHTASFDTIYNSEEIDLQSIMFMYFQLPNFPSKSRLQGLEQICI